MTAEEKETVFKNVRYYLIGKIDGKVKDLNLHQPRIVTLFTINPMFDALSCRWKSF